MNIQQWQEQVFNCPNMNPTAVAICLAIGSHGNWSDSQTVWPSRQRISTMTGASRETVGQYMTALEEQGWLKVVKIRKDNVKEYELSRPQVVETTGILAKNRRGKSDNLKNQVVGTKEQVVQSTDKQVVGSYDEVVGILDSNLPRTNQENLQEELTNTVPAAPVQLEEVKVREGSTTSPNLPMVEDSPMVTSADAPVTATFNSRDMTEAYIGWTRPIKDDEPFKARLKELSHDRTFEPHEARPNHRLQLAAETINKERGVF